MVHKQMIWAAMMWIFRKGIMKMPLVQCLDSWELNLITIGGACLRWKIMIWAVNWISVMNPHTQDSKTVTMNQMMGSWLIGLLLKQDLVCQHGTSLVKVMNVMLQHLVSFQACAFATGFI